MNPSRIFFACVFAAHTGLAQNLVVNGSFETPPAGGSFVSYGGGGNIGGWTVGGSGVDHIGGFWQAADGTQSVDLNGANAGSVFQDLVTIPGGQYRIRFALAGNPFGFEAKHLSVLWDGAQVGDFTFDPAGTSANAMGWIYQTINVTAPDALARLEFLSTTGAMPGSQGVTTFYGPALDDISVIVGVPEPGSLALLLGGAAACAVRRRAPVRGR